MLDPKTMFRKIVSWKSTILLGKEYINFKDELNLSCESPVCKVYGLGKSLGSALRYLHIYEVIKNILPIKKAKDYEYETRKLWIYHILDMRCSLNFRLRNKQHMLTDCCA